MVYASSLTAILFLDHSKSEQTRTIQILNAHGIWIPSVHSTLDEFVPAENGLTSNNLLLYDHPM